MGELKHLGRHKIVRVLGGGAMGVVYEAHDWELHRTVAVKTFIKSAVVDAEHAQDFSERFLREAPLIAQLAHPNIVPVYDFGEEGDVAYFVMKFVQGHDLRHYLDRDEQFPLPDALGYMIQLLSALDCAHRQGIIHCDIKPSNIMIDRSGTLKLTDFGVAKVLDQQDCMQTRSAAGTPACMSPEQILGATVSPRSDIFAAGMVLYQLLTWKKPFTGEDMSATQQKIVREDHAPPSTLNKSLPPALDQIVNKALAKKPDDRYASASEFSDDIKRLLVSDATPQAGIAEPQDDGQEIDVARDGGAEKNGAVMSVLEKYLAELGERDQGFDQQSARFATVMFSDLHDSAIAAGEDVLPKIRSDIVLPAIGQNNGVFMTSVGNGVLSYFENALDAVRAAARIQRDIDALNMSGRFGFPMLMRIGMDSGMCVAKENDIFGDVVPTACRLEVAADAGGILMSEDTFNAVSDKAEIYCRFVRQVMLDGRAAPCNAYQAFWNPQEIEAAGHSGPDLPGPEPGGRTRPSGMKLVWVLLAMIGMVLLLTLSSRYFGWAHAADGPSLIGNSVRLAGAQDAPSESCHMQIWGSSKSGVM